MTQWEGLNPPYRTIVADPPWHYQSDGRMVTTAKSAATSPDPNKRYTTMRSQELAEMPVREIADIAADLYLWTTNPILPEAFAVVEAWGFQYVTLLTWRKTGTLGMGYYFRGDTEHVLFAVRGKLPIAPDKRQRNWFEAAKSGHSIKPPSFFDLVERVSRPAPTSNCSPANPASVGTHGATATRGWRREVLPRPSAAVTTDALLTPEDVVRQLSALGIELDMAVSQLKDAEVEAVTKRHKADMVESRAFLAAEGAMELRKHTSRVAADEIEGEALVAEAVVRHLRTHIRALDSRIEIGRSYGAAVRAELKALGYGEHA